MYKHLLGLIALLSSQITLAQEVSPISVHQAAQMQIEKKATIIDVREDDEWQAGHIAGAIHIPLSEIASRTKTLEPYKNTPVIMQCRSGKRSAQAANILKAAGFSEVYNLEGGLQAWQKANLSIEQN